METAGKIAIAAAVVVGAATGFDLMGGALNLDGLWGTLVGGFAGFGVVVTLWIAKDYADEILRDHYRSI